MTLQTELGQLIDLLTAPENSVDLSKFSLEKHRFIVTYKTAFYSFYLPVALAMFMAGTADPKDLEQARDVLIPLGEYFQIQDDFLDCYGDPEVIGKIGTDIRDNKCSWLINKALAKANAGQRQILDVKTYAASAFVLFSDDCRIITAGKMRHQRNESRRYLTNLILRVISSFMRTRCPLN